MRVKVIYNPFSGIGAAEWLIPYIERELKKTVFDVEICRTSKRGDAEELARSLNPSDVVVCVGGDGTIHEVINGLPDINIPVLVIPCGTSNVLAVEFKGDYSVKNLVRRLIEPRPMIWDIGLEMNSNRKFALFASAGFDAEVVHRFHVQRRGRTILMQYFISGIFSMLNHRIKQITVEIDGKIIEKKAPLVLISNVSYYGGPLVFTPTSKPDDGWFEVVLVRKSSHRDLVRHLFYGVLRYFTGLALKVRAVDVYKAKRVRLFPSEAEQVPLQLDGEPAGFLPVDIKILPRCLRLI